MGKNVAFDVASCYFQVGFVLAMVDADDVLLDDWSFVEIVCDVVCSGTDQLYTASEGTLVWISS